MQHDRQTTQRHVSPDQALTLLVVHQNDDVSIGFEGYPWHTHADILGRLSGLPADDAVSRFVEAVTSNQAVIAIRRVNGVVLDIWVADDPLTPPDFRSAMDTGSDGEVITYRYWNGSSATAPIRES
jgi:hypothetical protein